MMASPSPEKGYDGKSFTAKAQRKDMMDEHPFPIHNIKGLLCAVSAKPAELEIRISLLIGRLVFPWLGSCLFHVLAKGDLIGHFGGNGQRPAAISSSEPVSQQ